MTRAPAGSYPPCPTWTTPSDVSTGAACAEAGSVIVLSCSLTSAYSLPRPERPVAAMGPYIPGAMAPLPAAAPLRSPAAGCSSVSAPSATSAHQPPGTPTGPPSPPADGFVNAAATADAPPAKPPLAPLSPDHGALAALNPGAPPA